MLREFPTARGNRFGEKVKQIVSLFGFLSRPHFSPRKTWTETNDRGVILRPRSKQKRVLHESHWNLFITRCWLTMGDLISCTFSSRWISSLKKNPVKCMCRSSGSGLSAVYGPSLPNSGLWRAGLFGLVPVLFWDPYWLRVFNFRGDKRHDRWVDKVL